MLVTAGVDEVGRGPLAWDVVAAAVILDARKPITGLVDSKAISEKRRERLYEKICAEALCYSIARATVKEIDEMNILQASLLAMKRAVEGLDVTPEQILVDGLHRPQCAGLVKAIVKGDQTIPEISAASIIAKW